MTFLFLEIHPSKRLHLKTSSLSPYFLENCQSHIFVLNWTKIVCIYLKPGALDLHKYKRGLVTSIQVFLWVTFELHYFIISAVLPPQLHPHLPRPRPANPKSTLIHFRHGGSGNWRPLKARFKAFLKVRMVSFIIAGRFFTGLLLTPAAEAILACWAETEPYLLKFLLLQFLVLRSSCVS